MPIVVLLDNSFSMNHNVLIAKSPYIHDSLSRKNLALHGLEVMFRFLKANNRYEPTALWTFSRTIQIISEFTRDYDFLKNCLMNIQTFDKTNLLPAMLKVSEMIHSNYNSELFYYILVITDGIALIPTYINQADLIDAENLNLPPKCKIFLVCLTLVSDATFQKSLRFYKDIIMKNCPEKPSSIEINTPYSGGQIFVPEVCQFSYQLIEDLFLKLCSENFKAFSGKIICGNLSGLISLYPNFMMEKIPIKLRENLDIIRICGFLNVDEISDPPIFSRHYVIPMGEKKIEEFKRWLSFINFKNDLSDEEIMKIFSEGQQPSFPVLLHGSLKTANMVALCEIGTSRHWYGIVHLVSDKKKSSLMLYTFKPGLDSVPWLGNFHNLSLIEPSSSINDDNRKNILPNKKKPSSYVVWLYQQSLQNDIQKINRFIKKLPDKYDLLCAEINRIHRTASALKFNDLINTLIYIFENDARQFPNSNNPEVIGQINHILTILKQ